MPRESYNVRILRSKAIASLRTGVAAFNGLDDDARSITVLLHLQHAFEMLLKAILEAKKDPGLFDKRTQKSISLERAINRCQQIGAVKLTDEEAGVIRHLDAMRDAEQHWHLVVDEGLLYHMGPYDLADKAGVDRTRAVALRRHLGLDNDDDHFSHVFKFGNTRLRRYSNNVLAAMREATKTVDLEKVCKSHRTVPSNATTTAPPCAQPGCAVAGP